MMRGVRIRGEGRVRRVDVREIMMEKRGMVTVMMLSTMLGSQASRESNHGMIGSMSRQRKDVESCGIWG